MEMAVNSSQRDISIVLEAQSPLGNWHLKTRLCVLFLEQEETTTTGVCLYWRKEPSESQSGPGSGNLSEKQGSRPAEVGQASRELRLDEYGDTFLMSS